jgi:sugar lactone lactonase YvrE
MVAARLLGLVAAATAAAPAFAAPALVPEVLIEGRFNGAEGLAFNGEGRLYMVANRTVWEVGPDGETRRVADSSSNLGLAALGPRDIAHADFGPLTWPRNGPNDDGVVWRITPEGEATAIARGIGDPNAIAVLPDGRLLVSDDFTDRIYAVTADGGVRIYSAAIPFPNGLALAPDGGALYVAQIFSRAPEGPPPARFTGFSDRVWRLPLADGEPSGAPEVLFETGGESGPDGLAIGPDGALYLTTARAGQLWRIDPATRRGELLADGFPGLASLAFGSTRFDPQSLYVVQIRGGRLLRFPLAQGACAALQSLAGDWEVFIEDRRIAESRIAAADSGCSMTESWSSAGQVRERRLIETLPGGGVRLQEPARHAGAPATLERATLAPLPDGSLRQLLETSGDEGQTWQSSSEATYRRRAH